MQIFCSFLSFFGKSVDEWTLGQMSTQNHLTMDPCARVRYIFNRLTVNIYHGPLPRLTVSTVMLTSNLPPVTCTSNRPAMLGVILDLRGPNLQCYIQKINKTHTYPNAPIHTELVSITKSSHAHIRAYQVTLPRNRSVQNEQIAHF